MNKTKSNPISLTSLELEQIGTAIKNLTNILNKYEVKEEEATGVSQKDFNKAFNDILDGSTQRYLNPKTGEVSTKKTSRIEVLDSNGHWLLDYDCDPENRHFWYQYRGVYSILQDNFSLQDDELYALMKSLVETQYNLKGVTPKCNTTSEITIG